MRFVVALFSVSMLWSNLTLGAVSSAARVKSPGGSHDGAALSFSGALATFGGAYGGTFLAGVSLPVERGNAVRVGFDSGIMFSQATWLPILVSVIYNLGTPGQSVRPYIGGAVGPFIRLSSTSVRVGGLEIPTTTGGGDGVQLGILLRPGLRINLAENLDLMAEIPLGGLTGIFYISPTLGISLRV